MAGEGKGARCDQTDGTGTAAAQAPWQSAISLMLPQVRGEADSQGCAASELKHLEG